MQKYGKQLMLFIFIISTLLISTFTISYGVVFFFGNQDGLDYSNKTVKSKNFQGIGNFSLENQKVCLIGRYNPFTNKCELDPILTCSVGTQYNALTKKCETGASILCNIGQYNSQTQKCETYPRGLCPPKFLFNKTTALCEAPAQYVTIRDVIEHISNSDQFLSSSFSWSSDSVYWSAGWCTRDLDQVRNVFGTRTNTWTVRIKKPHLIKWAGTTMLGGNDILYFYINNQLVVSVGKQCSYYRDFTSYFTSLPPDSIVTLQMSVYNKRRRYIGRKYMGMLYRFGFQINNYYCPQGTLNGVICQTNPSIITCPSGMTFNTTTKKCEMNPQYVCPSGMTFNTTTKKCEMNPLN
ncbi:MAG: hypothetical protein QXW71_03515 [Thermoplasmata archaeon]